MKSNVIKCMSFVFIFVLVCSIFPYQNIVANEATNDDKVTIIYHYRNKDAMFVDNKPSLEDPALVESIPTNLTIGEQVPNLKSGVSISGDNRVPNRQFLFWATRSEYLSNGNQVFEYKPFNSGDAIPNTIENNQLHLYAFYSSTATFHVLKKKPQIGENPSSNAWDYVSIKNETATIYPNFKGNGVDYYDELNTYNSTNASGDNKTITSYLDKVLSNDLIASELKNNNVNFDPNTQQIAWYSIRYVNGYDVYHVDGYIEDIPYYDIVFQDEDKTVLKNEKVIQNSLLSAPEPPIKDRAFLGWYAVDENDEITDIAYDANNRVIASAIYRAKYKDYEIEDTYYTIAFEDEDKSLLLEIKVKENEYILDQPSPTKTGYRFLNWYLVDKYGNVTNNIFDFNIAIDKNYRVRAKYQLQEEVEENTPVEPNPTPQIPSTPTTPNTPSTPSTPNLTTQVALVVPQNTPTIISEPNEIQEELVEPAKQPKASGEVVEDAETPKANINKNWALINLFATIITTLLSLIVVINYFKNKEEDVTLKKKGLLRVVTVGISIVSIILFIITENLTLPMVLVDKYTIFMLAILVLQIVITYLSKTTQKNNEERKAEQMA